MNDGYFEKQKGYVALFSAIIISAVLIVASVSLSQAGFWGMADVASRENKQIGVVLAESCVNAVLLGLAKGEHIFPPEIAVDGDRKCEIVQINGSNPYIIITRAAWGNSYANLKVTAELDGGEIKISDWRDF